MHVFIYVRPNVTRNVCTCQYATWQADLDKNNPNEPVLANNVSGSGERCDDKNRPAQAAGGEITHPLVMNCIHILAIEDAYVNVMKNPCKSDRTSLFEVWGKTSLDGIAHLNNTGRPFDPTWAQHRFSKAMLSEFGVNWSNRDHNHVEYVKYCERHSIVPQQEKPCKKPFTGRTNFHACCEQGCPNESLTRRKRSRCKECLEPLPNLDGIISALNASAPPNKNIRSLEQNGSISSAMSQRGMTRDS